MLSTAMARHAMDGPLVALVASLCWLEPAAAGEPAEADDTPQAAPPAQPAEGNAAERPAGSAQDDTARDLQRLRQQAEQTSVAWSVVEAPAGEARRAADRAHGARLGGDEAHAGMLDRLAVVWVEVTRSLLLAAQTESRAKQQADRARDLRIRLERARALLAEQQAHRWRLRAELERLGRDAPASRAAPPDVPSATKPASPSAPPPPTDRNRAEPR